MEMVCRSNPPLRGQIYVWLFLLFLFVYTFLLTGFTQEKDMREDIVVLNVEVPVRVMYKGKLVDNLKKSDFRLFENGKEQEINGFYLVRKKNEKSEV